MKQVLTLILITITLATTAQNTTVKGQLKDQENQEVPYATILFKSTQDTTFFGTSSDDKGNFTIEIPQRQYIVEISFVGIEPTTIPLDLSQAKVSYDIGVITLTTAVSLDEIIVTGNKATLKLDVDKKTYNVAQDIVAKGGTLDDVMHSLPSVQVEADGNVSIRGNQNVLILVDGKPSGLANTTQLYSTIPASTIEKVEVITNPSSKYSAQGAAGIINIVIKKGQKNRFNSSLEVFTGYRPLAGINGNISKSGENGSWYANAGLGYSEPKAGNDIFLQSPENIPNINYTSSDRIRNQYYYLINIGGTKNINDRNSLTGNLTYRGAQSDNSNNTSYEDFKNDELLSQSTRKESEEENNRFLNSNIDYTHQFKQEGHKLNINASGELSTDDEEATINGAERFPIAQDLNQDISQNKEDIRRFAVATDYTLPIKNYTFEIGYRGDFAIIENDFSVQRFFDKWTIIPELTDKTRYEENIHAFYGQIGRAFNQFSVKLGLRTEYTDIAILSNTINDAKNYTNLFPSAFFNYTFNENSKLQLSAFRRINRPQSWMIVPFTTFTDERNIFVGNIDINPSYVTATELSYKVILSDQLSFSPTLYYRITYDEMEFFVEKQQITIGDEPQDIFVSTMANIGVYETYGTELAASYQPLNWWSMYTELILNGFNQRGSVRGASFDGEGVLVSARYNSTFSFLKTMKLQLQNYYKGPIETGQYKRIGYYWLNVGLSTSVFKKNGTLSFNVRDVFNSNRRVITTFGPDFTRELDLQYRVRQMTLSFTYLFNQKSHQGNKGNQFDKVEIVN